MDTFRHIFRMIRFWFTTRAGREQELCAAARKGDADEVCFLLSCGVRVDGGDATGVIALQHAAEAGSRKVMELLLVGGARVDAKGFRGWQALHYAARDGHRSVVELLIEKGAKVDAADEDGCQPLHIAADHGKREMIELLVEKGAQVGAVDNEGRQPLHHAATGGEREAVEALIGLGAQVDAEDRRGEQPLHFAASRRMTLHKGSSLEITAMPFMKEHGAVISLLLAHEADPAAVSKAGKTPRDLCHDEENSKLLEKAEQGWQPLRDGRRCKDLTEHLKRQRKLGSLRPKGPSL